MKKLALLFWLLPWLALAQAGGGSGPIGGCAGPLNGCAGPLGQVTQTYVLDQLAAYPAVAYSVRQMTAGQYLPAYDMTVRRSSDNATANIGFSGGLLNTTALTSFCAATNCYVVTWKSQGSLGSSGDATQATAANQPQIVASGVVETQNGVPTVLCGNAGGAFGYMLMTGPTNQTSFSAYSVFSKYASNSESISLGAYPPAYGQLLRIDSTGHPHVYFGGDNASTSTFTSTSLQIYGTTGSSVGSVQPYLNGVASASFVVSPTFANFGVRNLATSGGSAGAGTGALLQGNMSEVVYFSSIISGTDRATYDLNAASFFGISGVTQ